MDGWPDARPAKLKNVLHIVVPGNDSIWLANTYRQSVSPGRVIMG